MINSIQIENFQSHEKTKIDFHPGVNSIIGSSDRGKTVILRALKKVILNKPGGTAFRSNWGGDTFIKVETDDEVAISRLVTDKVNGYYLDTPDGSQEFKAFGQGVPDEITTALNMDGENIQAQMDAPFLFSDSDGEVGRRLNEAANLEKIDKSQSYLDKKIRACKADLKQNKVNLKVYKDNLSSTDFIDDADNQLKEIEKLSLEYHQQEQYIADLSLLITAIQEANNKLSQFDFIDDALKELKTLTQLNNDYSSEKLSIESLIELKDELEDIEKSLNNTIDIPKAKKSLDLLMTYCKGVTEKEVEVDDLEDIIDNESKITKGIKVARQDYKELKEEFDELFPDNCPLCGGDNEN